MYYNSFSRAMRERYGAKIYKLSLSGGMTCPNRDGKVGVGGCIFCTAHGSGEFAAPKCGDIRLQLENAKKRVAFKAGKNAKYIAYFQDYSNTYAPLSHLKSIFEPLVEIEDVVALSIGTRPDCLPEDVLDYLEELNKRKHVSIELGLQTIHESTAAFINRCYPLITFDEAMRELKTRGMETVVHQIIGLPNETEDMIYETTEHIAAAGADGIKLHLLYVARGTVLEKYYLEGKFDVLDIDTYIRILEGCIRRLPPETIVHRMTGDGQKSTLVAPTWSADKKRVLAAINEAFVRDNVIQGSLYAK